MKKYVLVIFLLLSFCLTSCNNKNFANKPSIVGEVTEVNDTYIEIYFKNESYPSGGRCVVSLDVENSNEIYSPISVGDEVVVYFDGVILESYPMQINTVYAIILKTPVAREETYTQISMDEAISMMESESDYIILDVRTVEEYADKHIPNAINIPNETIGTEDVSALPDKDQMIFVYCRSGNRSKQASEKLAALGYTNVYEFGGIIDWTGETVSE